LLVAKGQETEEELIRKAREVGVRVYGLSDSCVEDIVPGKATVLLGFGAMSQQEIKEGVTRLKEAWL
jgi:GntR family transcriptional regulator/MocR family aminotransferase